MINILGKNLLLTMPGIFYVYFIVFIFLGSPIYFISKGAINIHYIVAVHLVLIILPVCISLTNNLMRVEFKGTFNTYLAAPVIDKQDKNHFILPFILILFVTLIVTSIYYYNLDIIPINYLLSNLNNGFEINELGKLRESATTSFKIGKLHRYNIFMVQLLPLLVIVALLKSKISESNIWKPIFVILTIITIYRCISDLQKGTIVDFIILLFLATCIYKGKINWRQVVFLIISIMVILSIMYYYIMGVNQDSFFKLLFIICKRLLITQTSALYHYFSLFPSSHEFLYGTSLPNPAGIFQFENFPLTKWIFVNGMYRNSQIVGTANSAFIGEMYANFGFPIMLVSVIIFSMVLQYIQIKFISKSRTLLLTTFYIYFVFMSSQFALTGLFVVAHLYLFIFLITAIIFVDGYKILYGAFK